MNPNTTPLTCPTCEAGDLLFGGLAKPCCDTCGYSPGLGVLATLRQIYSLPDALGAHACECGHPEMRRLPDGVFRCPACTAEVLPLRLGRELYLGEQNEA